MKAILIFPPFAMPSLPLGIASLKSYIETNSEHKVQCLDLNLLWHEWIMEDIRDKEYVILDDKKEFLSTLDIIKGKDGFLRQSIFDPKSDLYCRTLDGLHTTFQKQWQDAFFNKTNIPLHLKKFFHLIKEQKPDVVGFSIMFPNQFYPSIFLGKLLKHNLNTKIIVGGNSLNNKLSKLIIEKKMVDFVISGEGEAGMLKLLDALENNKDPHPSPNIYFNSEGKAEQTKSALVKDMEKLPRPDFSDMQPDKYPLPEPVIPVLSSRGCYWQRCAFCTHHSTYANTYRVCPVTKLVDDIEYYHKKGIKYFNLVDEMIPAARFVQIGKEIMKRNLKISYYTLAKPTPDFTEDVFEIMHKSGCKYILWGVESGCQRVLNLMDKGTKVEEISKVLEYSANATIKNHIFIIIGFPTETEEELKETILFLDKNRENIHHIHKGAFHLEEGALMLKTPEAFGITEVKEIPQGLIYEVNKGLTVKQAKYFLNHLSKDYFISFSYYANSLGILRDHALILYSNEHKLVLDKKQGHILTINDAWPPKNI